MEINSTYVHMYADYKNVTRFPVAQCTLLWKQFILRPFADVEIDCLYSSLWRSETEFNIVLHVHALISALRFLQCIKIL